MVSRREVILLSIGIVPAVIWVALTLLVPTNLGIAEVNRIAVAFFRFLLFGCAFAAIVSIVLALYYSLRHLVRLPISLISGATAIAFLAWAMPLVFATI